MMFYANLHLILVNFLPRHNVWTSDPHPPKRRFDVMRGNFGYGRRPLQSPSVLHLVNATVFCYSLETFNIYGRFKINRMQVTNVQQPTIVSVPPRMTMRISAIRGLGEVYIYSIRPSSKISSFRVTFDL